MRVCVASPDVYGPIRNGGIGTACTSLALLLAEAGHDVTLAFLLGDRCQQGTMRQWTDWYARCGVRFEPVPRDRTVRVDAPRCRQDAYRTYLWLRARPEPFDVVHFPEWKGFAYYCVLAKRLGLEFESTTFCVTTHSPSLWHLLGNRDPVTNTDLLDAEFLEAQSVALADHVVSPSRYMLDWIAAKGWRIQGRTSVLPNVLLPGDRSAAAPAADGPVEEIVFFGRLEERKGLGLFLSAMDRLAPKLPRPVALTFLGKPGDYRGRKGDTAAAAAAARWGLPCKLLLEHDRERALAHLRRPGRLAVMPSLVENSPYTVLECLAAGVPFLAAGVGGIPELIASEDRARVCFAPTAPALAARLEAALREGCRPARAAFDPARNNRRWLALHEEELGTKALAPAVPREEPLVSVCLVHRNRPALLAQALTSLRAQDYPAFEVILVDDGSDEPEALRFLDGLEEEFARWSWRIVRQENRYLGAARNHAARLARGEYLLFMDDDNVACPDELRTFVRCALASGADILTCVVRAFSGDAAPDPATTPWHLYVPAGANAALGLYENCFGDANALIRREVFEDLGGFTEDWGLGYEDWELYARAVLKGHRLLVVPRPLFWYRASRSGMLGSTDVFANHARSLRPYLEASPPVLHDALRLAQGLALGLSPAAAGTRFAAGVGGRTIHEMRDELDSLKRSWSWRVSKPVRFVEKRLARRRQRRD